MMATLKSEKGIYIVGGERKFVNSSHPDDKYDKDLYIPKGYILPEGIMLTREYARLHEDMAKKFIEENYLFSYNNDFIGNYKDYMLMRLHALQVMCSGQSRILYCDDNVNKVIDKAIASYLSYGWSEEKIYNPTKSYFEFIRYHLLMQKSSELLYEGETYEKKITK